ncbi:hypothetical protein EA472_17295 [Natrarchaeobius oligotrophus]|uniref:Uncharacterized protein n=1 Tax=Natrarchaeobius chitinivorans TaxID=1679083 RepID=A0A3N6MMD4_NATCH|nr:hypothetical protein EA472_17295 [Natrarchaeobius chitinivorans]
MKITVEDSVVRSTRWDEPPTLRSRTAIDLELQVQLPGDDRSRHRSRPVGSVDLRTTGRPLQ